ncbi:MAG: T9SS type A sorting domain-containing protein [Bacteroidota bacterium]
MKIKHIIKISILGLSIMFLNCCKKESNGLQYRPYSYEPKTLSFDNPLEYRSYLKNKNPDNPGLYFQIDKLRKTPSDLSEPDYPNNYQLTELNRQEKSRKSARTASVTWTSRGPANVPGRTRSIVVFEEDASQNSWLAGAVSGGLWFTDDAGQSWVNRTPNLPNLITTSIVRSSSDLNVFYVGTGESFASPGVTSGSNGNGIFKSTDGGISFEQVASTATDTRFSNINRIIVSPSDPDLVLVCSIGFISVGQPDDPTSFILRSTNGGDSWTEVFRSESEIQQIIASPDDFNIQFASLNANGIYKSTDAGLTWDFSSAALTSSGRIELDVSPVNTNHVFAYAQGGSNGTDADLYISRDQGNTWNLTREENGQTNIDNLLQGNYDNVVMAHPFDENTVYMGGVDLFKAIVSANTTGESSINVASQEVGTASFLSFVNFGGSFLGGGATTGSANEFKEVEIRFGNGASQNAHRFIVPANSGSNGNGTSGVPASDYEYQDYVNVPFEAWDISVSPERQLMISFRDQERNGEFNLTPQNDPVSGREYIFIHNLDYDAANPNVSVTVNGGHEFEQMYFIWPISNSSEEVSDFPESKLVFTPSVSEVLERSTINLSNARNTFGNNPVNGFDQGGQFGTTSQDGGLHPDHHFLKAINLNATTDAFQILNGNDGGVYLTLASTNPGEANGTWIFSGQGYNTGQFYGAVKQPGADVYTGGLQDNGSWTSQISESADETSNYVRSGFGDGFETVWNASDPDLLIVSSQFNNFLGSRNAGQGDFSQTFAADFGLTDNGSGLGPFVSRISSSNQNPGVVYAVGFSGVWKNTNFGIDKWNLTPINNQWAFNNITDVEVSLANPSIIWAGGRMDDNGRIFVSRDAGDSFEPTTIYNTVPLGVTSGVFTHPEDENTAYTLFSFADRPKVLRSQDLGVTWEDLSGFENGSGTSDNGFPDVAVYCLLVLPNDLNTIWVGTEIGIVESNDNGASWHLLDSDLPNVPVWQMQAAEDQVVLASHGRGIWTTTLDDVSPSVFIPNIVNAAQTPTGGLAFIAQLSEVYDELELTIDGGEPISLQTPASVGSFIFTLESNVSSEQANSVSLLLQGNVAGNSVESTPFMLDVFQTVIVDEYSNDFNASIAEDFILSGFDIGQEAGFDDGILSTRNPYQSFTEATAQLTTTIRVGELTESAVLFDNVAIVESGSGSGDFVVVEGSLDGINWEFLLDSYNASENSSWQQKETNDLPGIQSDFEETSFRLANTFETGELIFIRFRIFSDFNTEFWGWGIDNLQIQSDNSNSSITGVEEDIERFGLSVYPNPVINKELKGVFRLENTESVTLNITNVQGKLVYTQQVEGKVGLNEFNVNLAQHKVGLYIVELQLSDNSYAQRVIISD